MSGEGGVSEIGSCVAPSAPTARALSLSVSLPPFLSQLPHRPSNPSDARFPLVLRSFHPGPLLLYAPVVRADFIQRRTAYATKT